MSTVWRGHKFALHVNHNSGSALLSTASRTITHSQIGSIGKICLGLAAAVLAVAAFSAAPAAGAPRQIPQPGPLTQLTSSSALAKAALIHRIVPDTSIAHFDTLMPMVSVHTVLASANSMHASWGRRLHRLEPDPVTAPNVRWIFTQRLAGRSVAGIARELNDHQIPCPSGADPGRNKHRGGEGLGRPR